MPTNAKDRQIVRDLAKRVAEVADLPIQAERISNWIALNNLKPVRPMVSLHAQGGWVELVQDLKLTCESDEFRGIEHGLLGTLRRHELYRDDTPITKNWGVGWNIGNTGYGLQETYTRTEARGVFHWDPPIKELSDIKKLHPAELSVDRESSRKNLEYNQDLFGDIMNVYRSGVTFCRCGLTRKLIMLRGLDTMMMDMYDNPQFMHDLMAFLRDEQMKELTFYENENLLSLGNTEDSVGGSGGHVTLDWIPNADDYDPNYVKLKNMTCWGESQESVGVGPKQFDEFILAHQLPVLNRFGLVDYGCCETLDNKFDLLIEKIPHMRWTAVVPWGSTKIAAQKLKNNYVYVYKTQPSRICQPDPDWDGAEKEIRDMLTDARNCCPSIIMKDTTTFCNEPERVTRWTEMARSVAEEFAF